MGGGCGHLPAPPAPGGRLRRLDARAKVVGLIGVTIVAVSAPLQAWPTWVACALVLAAVAVAAEARPREIARRAAPVLPPVLFVAAFAPLLSGGRAVASLGPLTVSDHGLRVLAEVGAKATIGTAAAVLLGLTTTFPETLEALRRMRVPRTLTLIAAFMYRYLVTLVDEVRRMRAAMTSRGFRPRSPVAAAVLGRLVAVLFLRSLGRGERVYRAMLSRGYAGQLPAVAVGRLGAADAAFVAVVALALVPARVLAGMAA